MQTTYDLQHTGIGPSNPMSLENLNNKMNVYYTYGVDDDNLVSKINSVSVLYIVIRYQPFNVLFITYVHVYYVKTIMLKQLYICPCMLCQIYYAKTAFNMSMYVMSSFSIIVLT
jgi:hypothetical protein